MHTVIMQYEARTVCKAKTNPAQYLKDFFCYRYKLETYKNCFV